MTTVATERPAGSPAKPGGRRRAAIGVVIGAVALAGLWPLAWAGAYGGVTALIGAGVEGPSAALLKRELPADAVVFASKGHDGQQFYAIARHPFQPAEVRPFLDWPSYRERRILLPVLAGALAPHGGVRLIGAFLLLGLIGVALAAWACLHLPGAPPLLPLVVALVPGIGVALCLSLADALATGLALVALVVAMTGRFRWTVSFLVLASLTRETSVLAAAAIACAPGLTLRRRAVTVLVPAGVLAAWTLWATAQVHGSLNDGADQFSAPILGWLRASPSGIELLLALLTAALLSMAIWRSRTDPAPVPVLLGLSLGLYLMLGPRVTVSFVNTSRVVTVAMVVATWVLVRRDDPAASGPRWFGLGDAARPLDA